ncbi:MerR family DNA-binding transcriptional regulator [Streptomyces sp. 5-8]|uniref:MerR family DNA-binding transcriptional regulator n=1 Tax=Streptomyces musisoli TaxID=2802280 RepID=A0ABS1PCF8_9ACTN|nr:MerR family transcriptional regulator [Streptomyces musisoli]MBL1109860.1 MerR family DNA-binding transcriptional regulator [Streptomyces musisoli]
MQEPVGGPPRPFLRTAEVAGRSGYSPQQVRDLERLGVIPPAARSDNGYRSYTPLHVQALRAYRALAHATDPRTARTLLAELRTASLTQAAAEVSALHVRLARERQQALDAQQALRTIQAETPHHPGTGTHLHLHLHPGARPHPGTSPHPRTHPCGRSRVHPSGRPR